jgi:hypothetical protein
LELHGRLVPVLPLQLPVLVAVRALPALLGSRPARRVAARVGRRACSRCAAVAGSARRVGAVAHAARTRAHARHVVGRDAPSRAGAVAAHTAVWRAVRSVISATLRQRIWIALRTGDLPAFPCLQLVARAQPLCQEPGTRTRERGRAHPLVRASTALISRLSSYESHLSHTRPRARGSAKCITAVAVCPAE